MPNKLIPTNGVHVTPTYHPVGWLVARYDERGLTTRNRWFRTLERAEAYAAELRQPTLHEIGGAA